MPIIKRKKTSPLIDQLLDKGFDLRETSASKNASAQALADAAATAAAEADLAIKQALAIEKARVVLEDAGVTV